MTPAILHEICGPGRGIFATQLPGIAKINTTKAPYCVANEVVCGELARTLGLPVPPFAVMDFPPHPSAVSALQRAFVSLNFNPSGDRLPEVDPAECVRLFPEVCAGVVLFDILIVNTDRHRENLALDVNAPRLTIFDHDVALLGRVRGQALARLDNASGRIAVDKAPFAGREEIGNAQCLLTAVDHQHFGEWIDRIEAIPDFLVDDLAAMVRELGCSVAEGDALGAFLKERRAGLRAMAQALRGRTPLARAGHCGSGT